MKKHLLTSLLLLSAALANSNLRAQASPDQLAAATPAQRDSRMQWWREAKFGVQGQVKDISG